MKLLGKCLFQRAHVGFWNNLEATPLFKMKLTVPQQLKKNYPNNSTCLRKS